MPPKTRSGSAAQITAAPVPSGSDLFVGSVFFVSALAWKSPNAGDILKTIQNEGGKVVASVTKTLNYFVAVPEDAEKQSAKWKQASERSDVSVVSGDFVLESAKKGKVLDVSDYQIKASATPAPAAAPAPAAKEAPARASAPKQVPAAKQAVQPSNDDAADKKESKNKRKRPTKTADDAEEEEEEEKHEPAKMVKMIKKGRAAVDHECPMAAQCHVYEDGTGVYDAMLNQTEIKNNNNKFYVIQVLKSDTSDVYYAWTRWGRVGAKGQMSGMNPTSKERAISEFHKKFHDKTRNQWEDRDNFEKVPGKYFLIEREFGDDPEDEDEDTKPADAKPIPPSKLAQPVQDLVKLIFNVEMMTQSMQEIGYDAKKLPLGKLTKANIKKGYNALAKISDELNKARPDRSRLTDFSSEFYTIIPHSFSGRQVPPVIDTAAALKSKLQMVEALGDIEIATEILKATENLLDQNPVDVHFKKLNTELVPVKKDTEVYSLVEKYMRNTHAETHRDYELDIEDLFEVARNGEENRAKNLHNRQLLWHGSRLTNYVGILSQGLKIAPPEAPVTGYMFGKGIYFADMVSKSANYCFTSNQSPTGILLLCEVALGDQWQATNAEYNAREISEKKGCHSTYGQGKTMPDPKQFETLPGSPDVIVPCGKPINSNVKGAYLLYNEFITYDIEKVKIRYLIRTKFRHKY